ncbi:hypothetical protein KHU50_000383 [Colletotrichum sp. SAR 10_65]|nr:hypothetical protein KHU50_000383 [Colletotrichum sp. SAR 10_65]
MILFTNRGKGTIDDTDAEGYWDPSPGIIFRPPRSMGRQDLHLQDCDGDGDCGIIHVNSETNAVEVFLKNIHRLAQRGLGVFDYQFAIGKDRANLHWADVDGDGKDDMLWIEKFSGDTWVWYNGGRGSPDTGGGSSFYWRVQEKKAYYGLASGSCIYDADLDGNDHVDEHCILQSFNNKGRTSLNASCGLTDRTGDDGPITNPKLPVQPGPDEDDNTGGGSGGDHTPYVPNPKDDIPTCPDASKYTIIEQLEANAGLIDLWCRTQYAITILLQILQDSLARYDEIMAQRLRQSIGTLDSSCPRDAVYNDIGHLTASCYYRNFWSDAPQVEGSDTDDVTNLTMILNKALGDAKPLIDQLSASLSEIQAMSLEADPEDIVDSVSMSILLISDSVDFMEHVVEKTSFILNLLSAIFLVVSMGGSTLASAGLTSLGGAFVVTGEGAGTGLGICDMAQTPLAIRNSVQRQGYPRRQ